MTVMIQDDFGSQLAEFDKIQETCRKLLQTKHYAALQEHGIHAIMARAKTLGIHPFEALNGGFYVVSGRVGMSTEMMAALVRQRGHSIVKDPKSNGECVILHGKRKDNGDMWTCSFTKDDAIAAGLWNTGTWKKYPSVMLYNRCMSMLFRQLFPDLSLGTGYVKDELEEIAREKGPQVFDEIEVEALPRKEEEKSIDVKQLDTPIIPIITEEQANVLHTFLEGEKVIRADIIKRLLTLKIPSIDKITQDIYPKVLQAVKEALNKKLEAELTEKEQASVVEE